MFTALITWSLQEWVKGTNSTIKTQLADFPGSLVVKNLLANAGDISVIPCLGRPHMLQEQLSMCAVTEAHSSAWAHQ